MRKTWIEQHAGVVFVIVGSLLIAFFIATVT